MPILRKYPRTPHLEGSRPQPGDDDLASVHFEEIAGQNLVVGEKLDGANTGISFSPAGELLLQSRGHFLTGGPRERQFDLLKTWASAHRKSLWTSLGHRYVMYGEWLYAKHTLFYDALPHYFIEFDVLDTSEGMFLSTDRRRELLRNLPVASAPILRRGRVSRSDELRALVGPSRFRTARNQVVLAELCRAKGLGSARVAQETDSTNHLEGLYIKVEEGGQVVARCKFVRPDFLSAVRDTATHWLDRPIVPNQLRPGSSLWSVEP